MNKEDRSIIRAKRLAQEGLVTESLKLCRQRRALLALVQQKQVQIAELGQRLREISL